MFLIPEKKKLAHSSLHKSHMWGLSLRPPPTSKASLPLVSSAGSSSPPHHLKVGGPRAQASDLFSTYIHFPDNLIQFHGLKLYLYTHDSQCDVASPSGTSPSILNPNIYLTSPYGCLTGISKLTHPKVNSCSSNLPHFGKC